MSLTEQAGVYFARFSIGGKQLKRSLKTSDKELARRLVGCNCLAGLELKREGEMGKFWRECLSAL